MPDLATLSTTWNYPTTVLFGAGSLRRAGEAAKRAGMRRPLLVTDPGVAALPVTEQLLGRAARGDAGARPLQRRPPQPHRGQCRGGPQGAPRRRPRRRRRRWAAAARSIPARASPSWPARGRQLWDFEDLGDNWKRADPAGVLPVVAIPTTAGTGSEVGRGAVITDPGTHRKRVIFHPTMLPRTAILDAAVTVGLPARLTVGTGMDALAHCLEAYCAPGFHPMAEGIAVEGIRLVKEALPQAAEDGTDLRARGMMLTASAMGAVAFQKGLGAIHSLSHPVGALYDTHHGMTNAVVMPYVLAHNRPAIEDRINRLAAWLGVEGGFPGFLDWVLLLRERLGVPPTLAALGVPDDRLDEMAPMALEDPTAGGNPVPLTLEDLRRLYRHCHDGTGI